MDGALLGGEVWTTGLTIALGLYCLGVLVWTGIRKPKNHERREHE